MWDRGVTKRDKAQNLTRRIFDEHPSFLPRPSPRDICDQEMAGARCRFPRRVKRSTVKLIESFKVIGIDNGEVNKSHPGEPRRQTLPLPKGWSVEGFAGGGSSCFLVRAFEEVEKRDDQGERNGPPCHIPLLKYQDPPPPPTPTTSDIVYSGEMGKGVCRLGPL